MAFGASAAARWQATHLDEIELDLLEHKLVSRDFREVQQVVDDTQEMLTSRLNDSLLAALLRDQIGKHLQLCCFDNRVEWSPYSCDILSKNWVFKLTGHLAGGLQR